MTDYTKLIERLRDAGSDLSLTNEGDMLESSLKFWRSTRESMAQGCRPND